MQGTGHPPDHMIDRLQIKIVGNLTRRVIGGQINGKTSLLFQM